MCWLGSNKIPASEFVFRRPDCSEPVTRPEPKNFVDGLQALH
jgi:hypothetical protein